MVVSQLPRSVGTRRKNERCCRELHSEVDGFAIPTAESLSSSAH